MAALVEHLGAVTGALAPVAVCAASALDEKAIA
jgi:hypothetical protein